MLRISENRPQITILTDPVPVGAYFFTSGLKNVARRSREIIGPLSEVVDRKFPRLHQDKPRNLLQGVRDRLAPLPRFMDTRYGGHAAVTRSMVKGLQKIGAHVTYNPQSLAEVGDVVVVPGGCAALEQAIKLKAKGYIHRLLAGTNLVDFPSERKELMCANEIDLLLVPGDWFRDNFIADSPELDGKVVPWPAGVDIEVWKPELSANKRQILFFEKQTKGPVGPISNYTPIVEKKGYEIGHLKYGNYMPEDLLREFQKSCLMVGFVTNESQGIAWAEAWATDVPTLLWNQDTITYKGRTYKTSSAPYLTPETGMFFTSLAEFESVFNYWEENRKQFNPRQWVLENMSDEACARNLCKLAQVDIEK